MDALYHNSALGLLADLGFVSGHLAETIQNVGIGNLLAGLLLPFLDHLIDDLALFQTAVSDGRQNRIPVLKGITLHHLVHEFWLVQIRPVDSFRLAIAVDQILTADNIILF